METLAHRLPVTAALWGGGGAGGGWGYEGTLIRKFTICTSGPLVTKETNSLPFTSCIFHNKAQENSLYPVW